MISLQPIYIHILWKKPISYLSDCILAITGAKNCLKISVNQIFYQYEFFKINYKIWFLVNLYHSL